MGLFFWCNINFSATNLSYKVIDLFVTIRKWFSNTFPFFEQKSVARLSRFELRIIIKPLDDEITSEQDHQTKCLQDRNESSSLKSLIYLITKMLRTHHSCKSEILISQRCKRKRRCCESRRPKRNSDRRNGYKVLIKDTLTPEQL